MMFGSAQYQFLYFLAYDAQLPYVGEGVLGLGVWG